MGNQKVPGMVVLLHGSETCTLEARFHSTEQPTVTRSEVRRRRWLDNDKNHCTTSDVWLGALSWCRKHCPCPPHVAPLPPNCIAQPLQNLDVRMSSDTLSRRYELLAHQDVEKEFRELSDCPLYITEGNIYSTSLLIFVPLCSLEVHTQA
jgi:hypothetical protein